MTRLLFFRRFFLIGIASSILVHQCVWADSYRNKTYIRKLPQYPAYATNQNDNYGYNYHSFDEDKAAFVVRSILFTVCSAFLLYHGWKNRYHIGASVLGGDFFLRDMITINGSQCRGREVKINPQVSVIQLMVKSQFSNDGGGYASCGYQAPKNNFAIMQALRDNTVQDLQSKLNDPQRIKKLFGDTPNDYGVWRKLIVPNRIAHNQRENATLTNKKKNLVPVDGEWVDSREMDRIINYEYGDPTIQIPNADQNLLNAEMQRRALDMQGANIQNKQIAVLDSVGLLGGNADHVSADINQLLRGNNADHYALCVGTMHHSASKNNIMSGTSGHWFGVVVHKDANGNRQYIVTDSANNALRWYGDYYIAKILATYEGAAVAKQFKDIAS